MKKRAVILSALLIAGAVAMAAWLFAFRPAPRVSGPLRHEVYVWQRAWTQPVRDALFQHATNFAELVPLVAEISWKDSKPEVTRVALDYAALALARRPVGIALRIGPYPGPFAAAVTTQTQPRESGEPEPKRSNVDLLPGKVPGRTSGTTLRMTGDSGIATYLADLAASLIAEARTNHVNLCELQVDFDCAESKLDGYRLWVETIQKRVAPLPVTITALPSWLNSRGFRRLAASAPNYVLQVHSLKRPENINARVALCDPQAASQAIERAGRIGVPFRAALPTYGYLLAFDRAGKFLSLSAEGAPKVWPAGTQLREVSSNPAELAMLVTEWTASRPQALRGIIWYRLPVAVDRFNWRWPTLGAIVAGRSPRESLRAESRRVAPGLIELVLINDGELDVSSSLAVEVRWIDARLVTGDGLGGFELADQRPSAVRFQRKAPSGRLPAGEKLILGHLQFDRDCEVQLEIKVR